MSRRILKIDIPLDIAGSESALDLTVARQALEHAIQILETAGRTPEADERDDRHLLDAESRKVGWLYVRMEEPI